MPATAISKTLIAKQAIQLLANSDEKIESDLQSGQQQDYNFPITATAKRMGAASY